MPFLIDPTITPPSPKGELNHRPAQGGNCAFTWGVEDMVNRPKELQVLFTASRWARTQEVVHNRIDPIRSGFPNFDLKASGPPPVFT